MWGPMFISGDTGEAFRKKRNWAPQGDVCFVHQSFLFTRFRIWIHLHSYSSLSCYHKSLSLKTHILGRGQQAASSLKEHDKYLEHIAEPDLPSCHADEQPSLDPCMPPPPTDDMSKRSVAFGFSESSQREFGCCGGHTFSFLAYRGWTEEIS